MTLELLTVPTTMKVMQTGNVVFHIGISFSQVPNDEDNI